MRPLFSDPDRLRLWAAARRKLVFLDFDGTLVSIARLPRGVRVSGPMRALLRGLVRRRDVRVCVISGRALNDLKRYFRLPGLILVGNHGYEVEGLRVKLPGAMRQVHRLVPHVKRLEQNLKKALSGTPGVYIENKAYTLSVHFRNVPRGMESLVSRAVNIQKRRSENRRLQWRRGKKVWEARPGGPWDKGRAAQWIAARLRPDAVLVIGDDRTDEDMFVRLKGRALTVRVGFSRASKAAYFVRRQEDVARVLERIGVVSSRRKPS